MGCIGLGRFGCLRLVSLCFSFFMFFPDLVLLGADPFSHPVISRSFPFHYFPILFPSFSILFHPCPILSPSYPFLSHPQYSVGLQDLPRERLQDRLENDGSQVDLLVFSKTPGGHRVDTMPYEWTLPHANPYEWNPSTEMGPILVHADSFCRPGTGLPHEPI